MSSLGRLTSALAIIIRWRCPPEKVDPLSMTTVRIPIGMRRTSAARPADSKASHARSTPSPEAPSSTFAHCRSARRRSGRPPRSGAYRLQVERVERLAVVGTAPAVGASKPSRSRISVDLPAPEGPTTATNSPGATDMSTSVSTGGVSGEYEKDALLISIRPSSGPGSSASVAGRGAVCQMGPAESHIGTASVSWPSAGTTRAIAVVTWVRGDDQSDEGTERELGVVDVGRDRDHQQAGQAGQHHDRRHQPLVRRVREPFTAVCWRANIVAHRV